MRTRSQASSKNGVARKRKKGDDSVAQNGGARSKRRKLQTLRDSSDQEVAHHSSANAETADELCSASVACRDGDDGSIKKMASKKKSRKGSLRTEIAHGILPTQGVALKSCSSVFERNSDTQGNAVQAHEVHQHEQNVLNHDDSIQHHDDCHDIEGTAILLGEPQSQSEKDHKDDSFPTPAQEGAGTLLHSSPCKRKGTLLHNARPRMNSSHSGSQTDVKRRNKGHSRPSTEQNKQMKNHRRANTSPVPQKSKSLNRTRMNAAKLRWKHLAQSILYGRVSPGNTSASDKLQVPPRGKVSKTKEQTECVENRQSDERQSLGKRRLASADRNREMLASRRKLAVTRQQRKLGKHQHRLLKWMKTWLTQAKFSQVTRDENSNHVGESFIMTEDQRNAFVQTMVKSCQHNPKMRTLFLESVKILTMSGLMHAAASTVLQEESCEQAQSLMNAWAAFQEQDAATKKVPLNLLNAVNQLHETRGDLSTKLNTSEDSYELKQLDEKTWKFKLPNLPIKDQSFSLPNVKENLEQNDIPV